MRCAMLRSDNIADSQPILLGELTITDSSHREKSSRQSDIDIMASDHISFQFRSRSYPQNDEPEQHHETTLHSAQQQYHQQWDLPTFEASTPISLQYWPWTYSLSGDLTQGVDTSTQRSQLEPLLDLGLPPPQDAVNKLDPQSLVKPAAEAPFLPRSTNVTHGYYNNAYVRSPGVMSEPLKDEEICSIVESDLCSKLDSGFYSQGPCPNTPSFRQDVNRDDRSEVSAILGVPTTARVMRPIAGRILSDNGVVAHHGKRRRSSQPLPACSLCTSKPFIPRNRSDQTYVYLLLHVVGHQR